MKGRKHAAAVAGYSLSYRGRLVPSFWEDPVTLAWDAVKKARLPEGTGVLVEGLELPGWWWTATGLVEGDGAWNLSYTEDGLGGHVTVARTKRIPSLDSIREDAQPINAGKQKLLKAARDGAPRPEDEPLGVHITGAHYERALIERLRFGPGEVESWTTIGQGAAPSEFVRLQQAHGPYHVAIIGFHKPKWRTVALWQPTSPPETGQIAYPRMRRLMRHQGQWRYGLVYGPDPVDAAPKP